METRDSYQGGRNDLNIVSVVLDSQKLLWKILSSTVSFPGNFSKIFPMIRLAVSSPSSVEKKNKKQYKEKKTDNLFKYSK